ncbi:ATP-binding protein [Fulvivirga ulvae]|uniref:two-component regulator propeller domain-containing protein n=1 Tax=Fulvivirga ulvae TaxID=2904245 RepID=UPI001F192391|nr:two-component regulator propeller domain-containing protein [Fulvivirga ulvae]UII34581.1 ATP-binding protein [Fulvivirga ulvae]
MQLQGQGDNTRFEHISWEEGLSQVTVQSIIQDSRGFMWFATEDGLNKYNGYEFTIYRHNAADSGSLCSNRVTDLFEDSRGRLWAGTKYGLSRFNKNSQTFVSYRYNLTDSNSLSNNMINGIAEDRSGNIWIATPAGLNKYISDSDNFDRYDLTSTDSTAQSDNFINDIGIDLKGNLWLATVGGLKCFDPSTSRLVAYTFDAGDGLKYNDNQLISLFINRDEGTIWLGTAHGLYSFDPEKEKFTAHYHPDYRPNVPENHIFSISQDNQGKVWFGTMGGGLYGLDSHGKQFSHYVKNNQDPYSLSDNAIVEVYIDRLGYVWLGTQAGGINRTNGQGQNFRAYYEHTGDENSLSGSTAWDIFEDSDSLLWVATDQGLNSYNRESGQWRNYSPEYERSASNRKTIWSGFEDNSGSIWIGKNGEGLGKLNKETGELTYYHDDPDKPGKRVWNVWRVREAEKDFLWIATLGSGLKKFDRSTGKFIHYTHDQADDSSLSNDFVWSMLMDGDIMWLGTGEGLNRFDIKNGKFTHYKHDPTVTGSISNNNIYALHEGDDGILWVGTNNGLNKFDKTTGTFKAYQEQHGLVNNVIYGILEDGNGYLWLSTNKGLSKFDPRAEVFKNFDASDGLQSNEFNAGAYYKTQSGEMCFGGINGFNIFHPDSIRDNLDVPPVVITSFEIFNKPVPIGEDSPLKKHITETDEIALSYDQSVFSFGFAALNYTSPEANEYAYMLEGFDEDWYNVEHRRFVTYTNIPPGTYTFRVKGSNNDGVWNEEGTSIVVTIVPPFWQTYWFYTLLIVAAVLLVVIIFQLRLRNLRKARKLLEKQVDKQTRELKQEKERVVAHNERLNDALHELKEAQTQLVQSEKMASLGQLTAGVAHEINNPVNFVSAGIDSLRVDYEDILALLNRYRAGASVDEIEKFEKEIAFEDLLEEIEHLFGGIKDGAVRTREIVKSLQSFSRLDEGNLKRASINEGIEATLVILKSGLENRIEVVRDFGDLPEIECYPGQINQVFMNILSNAIQAIDGPGMIRISTSTEDNHVVVKIEDSGKGISQEHLNKIFDPFFTTKDVGQGTGLGLSISYGIIARHHGKILVKSHYGEGTTFTIRLPVTPVVQTI